MLNIDLLASTCCAFAASTTYATKTTKNVNPVRRFVIPFFRITLTGGSDFWRYFNNCRARSTENVKVKAEILPKYYFMHVYMSHIC